MLDAWLIKAPLRRHLGLSRLHTLWLATGPATDAHGALRKLVGAEQTAPTQADAQEPEPVLASPATPELERLTEIEPAQGQSA
jgi:hypothetical protein